MRLAIFIVALLLPLQAFAGTVSRINVEGNERTDPNTIRVYLTLKEGDEATPAAMDASVRSLFKSGLFRDVKLSEEGGTLNITVKENPIINRVAVEGSDQISFDKVKSELKLGPRSIYTVAKVQDDMDRIYQLYRAKGYFAAKVEPQIIERDQNRVDLIFKVTEGPDSRIRRIDFIGNKAFSRSELRDQVFSIEEAWWNFLSDNDVYDPDRLNADQERMRRFYAQSGYPDFKVENAIAEFSPDQSGFFLTFTVDEGPRYKFGEVKIVSEKEGLDAAPLEKLIRTDSGDWYNSDRIEDTIQAMTDDLNRKNYAFLIVDPKVKRNEKERTIDVVYTLRDGPKVYVERIDVKGNLRTQDRVIRREFTLAEGDPLNPAKLKQSENKVRDLDYFKKTIVRQVEGSAPDRKVIEVEVEEQSTGDLQIGAGYSTEDGALADFGIKEKNLLGRGQTLGLSASLSQRRQNFNVSFTEPYFLERNVAASFDIFNTRTDNERFSSYVRQQAGFGVRFGYPLSQYLRQQIGYRLVSDKVSNVDSTASIYIKEQEGQRLTSMVSHDLTYDRRDSRLFTTQGYVVSLTTDTAGLGGDTKYMRNVLSAKHYWSMYDTWIFMLSGEGGYIFGFEEDRLNINDRFFIGGQNFRGFKFGGVGPRDITADDALGGNRYIIGTAELTFPLGLDDLGIKGHAFTDTGTVGDPGFKAVGVEDDESLRLSAGFGLSWRSPFGPIRIDIAQPIVKNKYDEEQLLRVGFGTRF